MPDPTFSMCIEIGGPCQGTTQTGYCLNGDEWVWCDPIHGLSYMHCPSVVGDACYGLGGGLGACGCGSIDANGVCGYIGAGPPAAAS